ncbi:MAG: polyribonucleotide nucleotidyltransferase [Candidatus Aminicenantaceae bacterium]
MSDNKIILDINNQPLTIELNKYGRQADGSAYVRYGDTVVFMTACSKKEVKEVKPFLPLIVDYRENTYAAGKIPGGFFKREGRPSEREILIARLIDRPVRTLFPEGYTFDTQLVGMLLSADIENDPDTLGIIAASVALYFSDIPFTTPLGAVRVGLVDGNYMINPPKSLVDKSPLNMVVVGTEQGVVMLEAGALEVDEDTVMRGIEAAMGPINQIIQAQKDLFARLNIQKRPFSSPELDQEKFREIEAKYGTALMDALLSENQTARNEKKRAIQEEVFASLPQDDPDQAAQAKELLYQVQKKLVRRSITEEGKRPDGRSFDQIRPITIETGSLPRTHGSAVFTRGETQCLATVTLGTFEDTQRIDSLGEQGEKRFMLHYNFPPFSVGEVQFLRGPGRREIGHGALAEKSIKLAIPTDEAEFPYTIRIVSDILESNGSSSMATVCGGVLALMDAGVPLTIIPAGIAMGVVKKEDTYSILTDIAGLEDFFGDMDLKVSGTEKGITAIQMDLKIPYLPLTVLEEGLTKAREARLQVLAKMKEALPAPRPEISPYAPRIISLYIDPERVGEVIGPSGKIIKRIVAESKAKVEIEEGGKITIASPDMEAVRMAEKMIRDITEEAEVGKAYEGKVVRLEEYGAFIQILPNVDGLLHISEVSHQRTNSIRDVMKMGQLVRVKVISIDDNNKVRLSKKALEEGGDRNSSSNQDGDRRDSRDRDRRGGRGGYPNRDRYNKDRS